MGEFGGTGFAWVERGWPHCAQPDGPNAMSCPIAHARGFLEVVFFVIVIPLPIIVRVVIEVIVEYTTMIVKVSF